MKQGQRVAVVAGPLSATHGTVIRDDNFPDRPAVPKIDRVWVKLDSGDNPQHFASWALLPVSS